MNKEAGGARSLSSESRVQAGMIYEKDVPIEMSDGISLRANVYRPEKPGRYPVVMAQGVYGKDVHFSAAYAPQWKRLLQLYPELIGAESSGTFLRWETVDPERWVPDGFVVIQVDSRGAAKSPGYLDPFCPREIIDYAEAIEWAGTQDWSNGRVGLIGISYYAMALWRVAARKPKHLAAIIPWEGGTDYYRDWRKHGGISSNLFTERWWRQRVVENQHGNGRSGNIDAETGKPITGEPLSEDRLAGNRTDYLADVRRHLLDDDWFKERSADVRRIEVPLLSAGNLGGPGVHLRGNVDGFMNAASEHKWLFLHTGTHFESFYKPEYVARQKRFFNHFLRDERNGWIDEPRVQIEVRRPDGKTHRTDQTLPLAGTQWTKLFLDRDDRLGTSAPSSAFEVGYEALSDGVTFRTQPFAEETEFTGFVAARLWIKSSTTDMDLFLTLRAFDPSGAEVVFDGAHEPVPVARGWLRASHRKLDPERALPYLPYHSHDEIAKLEPGQPYAVDVEIWPTSIVLPKGYTLALTVAGRDFELPGIPGRILHNCPLDRDPAEFGGTCTILSDAQRESYLLLPLIPAR